MSAEGRAVGRDFGSHFRLKQGEAVEREAAEYSMRSVMRFDPES